MAQYQWPKHWVLSLADAGGEGLAFPMLLGFQRPVCFSRQDREPGPRPVS